MSATNGRNQKRNRLGPKSDVLAPNGMKIRDRRLALQYSQADVSRLAGISKGYLSHIENGHHHRVSRWVMSVLADALGVAVEDLGQEIEEPEDSVPSTRILSAVQVSPTESFRLGPKLDALAPNGKNIRDRRLALQYSQADVSRLTGVSKSYISHIENNYHRRVSRWAMSALADALGVAVEDLGQEIECPNKSTSSETTELLQTIAENQGEIISLLQEIRDELKCHN